MRAVLLIELLIRLCKLGNDVLSDDAFHVMMFVACSVSLLILEIGRGMDGSGGGDGSILEYFLGIGGLQ
jgi:hypothetical protein